jgi:hypothetical protein
MQRCVTLVCKIWITYRSWVVLDDAFDEEQVVGVDCATQAGGDVNPVIVSTYL